MACNKDKTEFTCVVCNKKICINKKSGGGYNFSEKDPTIFKMVQYRIENKFYKLKDGKEYNPVIRKVMNNDEPILVADDEHDKYFQEVRNLLC